MTIHVRLRCSQTEQSCQGREPCQAARNTLRQVDIPSVLFPMVVIHKHRRVTSTYVVYWHEALKHPSIAPLSKVQTIRVSKHACQSPFVSGRTSSSAMVPSSARQRQRRADSAKHVAVRPGNISQCQGRAHEPTIGSERPVTSRAWVFRPMQSLTLPCAGPCSIGEVTSSPAAVHLQ